MASLQNNCQVLFNWQWSRHNTSYSRSLLSKFLVNFRWDGNDSWIKSLIKVMGSLMKRAWCIVVCTLKKITKQGCLTIVIRFLPSLHFHQQHQSVLQHCCIHTAACNKAGLLDNSNSFSPTLSPALNMSKFAAALPFLISHRSPISVACQKFKKTHTTLLQQLGLHVESFVHL